MKSLIEIQKRNSQTHFNESYKFLPLKTELNRA